MRKLASLVLIGLLLLCPVICGAAEIGHGPGGHGTSADSREHAGEPESCPEDGDNCICQGAVRSVEVRVADHSADASDLPFLPHHFVIDLAIPRLTVASLAEERGVAASTGWHDARVLRAWLQCFLC